MSLARPPEAPDPVEILGTIGIIPVVAIDDPARAAPLARALLAGGIGVAEVTIFAGSWPVWRAIEVDHCRS